MRINFTFRNIDSSDGIKSYASEKVGKLQKYLRAPLDAEVTVSTERHLHRVDVMVSADGHRYAGHEESEDMYASIDMVMDKIDRQVRNTKATITDRKRHGGPGLHLGKDE
ncbi:MAG: ribosome-associated translation inhibitor RaiA [Myxococcales bacterium]|nr:ribosome-associated translation inhibitor RaiA [Myxococcales bacterium]